MKGKAAVQNANRRTIEAIERADRLTAALAEEKRLRQQETAALTAELREVRSTINQLAEATSIQRAAEKVAHAERRLEEVVTTQRQHAVTTVDELFQLFLGGDLDTRDIVKIAQRFGIEPHEVTVNYHADTPSRYTRRLTWGEYLANNRRIESDLMKMDRRTYAGWRSRLIAGSGDE